MLTLLAVWLDLCLVIVVLMFVAPRAARIAVWGPFWLLATAFALVLLPVALIGRCVTLVVRAVRS